MVSVHETLEVPSLSRPAARATGRFLSLAIFLGCLVGCGYAPGFQRPDGVETIAVPTFDNLTFPLRREVEHELTAAVRRELQSRSPLRLVASEHADLTLYGTVVQFDEYVVAEGRRDEKLESSIVLTVELLIEDYQNHTVRRETVLQSEPISIAGGESFEAARGRAIDNLAERILILLEAW